MKRHVKIDNVHYILTYDEYDVLDTVTIKGSDEPLSSKNKVVKKLLNNAYKILSFEKVAGISYNV